ncbi:nitroreductase/quinone reductase family protein [Mycobacterium sp.]|uniref:nitroreductase/quinone reductase family protein n=1 Tax=Mycobacterium sp. TaxID=1785 RepID=UPI003D0FA0EA
MSTDESKSVMESERSFNEQNIAEFRANGGKVGGQFEGFPLLLLTSTGVKTGTQRVNPVGYFDIDGKIFIVGSAAGRDKNPAWVANIRGNPQVRIEIGAKPATRATTAELPRPERDRIFDIIKQRAPGFGEYETSTDRVIPVFEVKLN